MLLCVVAQTAVPLLTELGRNPPWKQPQLMFLALSKSPTFFPVMVTNVLLVMVQSSSARDGRASPISDPPATTPVGLPEVHGRALVSPEIRCRTPGADGPNVGPKKLSLMA